MDEFMRNYMTNKGMCGWWQLKEVWWLFVARKSDVLVINDGTA